MKYKIGDLVKIKSKTWWNKKHLYLQNFPSNMAEECCGKLREIINVDENDKKFKYFIENHQNRELQIRSFWWLKEEWIEKKIETWKIKLKQLKEEL